MIKPELLSPCGDYNCFLSAINAGADAVYLSSEKFGARAYAKNFTEDEVVSAIDYAHLMGAKVYLTVNTLVKNKEIEDIYETLLPFYKAGLDGVIVQDIGVISYISKHFPGLDVHASTQMAITSKEGVNFLKNIGVTRAVLARELSLKEISDIYDETGVELECFVHGALCYSYSGKCLFSSLIGGRSGNRGRCAGSCRQPYNGKYLLSTKDICCLKLIPKLCEANIASFKIEGRMKSPEYVAGVTGIYRKHIDRYFDLVEKHGVSKAAELFVSDKTLEEDYNTLIKLYTRGGNSDGYYFKHNDRDMITLSDASYTSSNEELRDEIFKQYICEKKIPVYAFVSMHEGLDAMLSLSTDNASVTVYGGTIQKSIQKPLAISDIEKQLNKTGNTAFTISDIQYDVEDNIFMRISEINELRRNAFDSLKEEILKQYRRNTPLANAISEKKVKKVSAYEHRLMCEINDIGQLDAVIKSDDVTGIYIPLSLLIKNNHKNIIDKVKASNKKLYLKFQSVIRYNYLEKNKDFIKELLSYSDGALIDNYELIYFLKEIGYTKDIIGDIHLYALNLYAKTELSQAGINRCTVPVELNKGEILSADYTGDEMIVYGRLPMMISAQCINNTLNGCDKKTKCYTLKDRTGAEFIDINDCTFCSNTVYNSVPLSLHGEADTIERINPYSLRVIFTDESADEIENIIKGFSLYTYKTGNKPCKEFTRGHFNRGVL